MINHVLRVLCGVALFLLAALLVMHWWKHPLGHLSREWKSTTGNQFQLDTKNAPLPTGVVLLPGQSARSIGGGDISITSSDIAMTGITTTSGIVSATPEGLLVSTGSNGNATTSIADGEAACKEDAVHCDPLSDAVMKAVQERLTREVTNDNDEHVWSTGAYAPEDVARFKAHIDEIKRVQAWAKALPAGQVRSEYLSWLDYYRGNSEEALKESVTQAKRKEMAEYNRKLAECARIARQFEATHKIPLPPD